MVGGNTPQTPQQDPGKFPEFSGNASLDQGKPAVAAAPGRALTMLVGLVVVVGFMLYTLFSNGEPEQVNEVTDRQEALAERVAPREQEPLPPPDVAPVPELPVVPPPPPPPPLSMSDLNEDVGYKGPNDQQRQERIRSNMIITQSGTFSNKKEEEKSKRRVGTGIYGDDPNSSFAQSVLSASEAESSAATSIGDTAATIAQGKILDAVLETAINTDLPGTLRAIVSRDVYAEAGPDVLISKGSRLIGTYNTAVHRGQKRVYVIWTRVIRPDGVDIQIGSPGIDQLGRAGVAGIVDNKYLEIFSSALLTSSVTLATAFAVESMVEDPSVTRTHNSDGSTETTGTPTAQAAEQMVNNMGVTAQGLIDDFMDLRPTIMVDQGTLMKVFVNRDLIFPPSISSRVTVIR